MHKFASNDASRKNQLLRLLANKNWWKQLQGLGILKRQKQLECHPMRKSGNPLAKKGERGAHWPPHWKWCFFGQTEEFHELSCIIFSWVGRFQPGEDCQFVVSPKPNERKSEGLGWLREHIVQWGKLMSKSWGWLSTSHISSRSFSKGHLVYNLTTIYPWLNAFFFAGGWLI